MNSDPIGELFQGRVLSPQVFSFNEGIDLFHKYQLLISMSIIINSGTNITGRYEYNRFTQLNQLIKKINIDCIFHICYK